MTPPSRLQVAAWWRELLDGRCSREKTYERVRPWVEDTPDAVDDPLHDDGEVRAAFERWLTHRTRFDADPVGWQRDRDGEALAAVLRDGGRPPARALADRLVAAGRLSAADARRILRRPADPL